MNTYTPGDLAGELGSGSAVVVVWVGTAVGVLIAVVFILRGIWIGVSWGIEMIRADRAQRENNRAMVAHYDSYGSGDDWGDSLGNDELYADEHGEYR